MCSFIESKSMNSGCIMLGVRSTARMSRHISCLQEAYNLTTLIYLYLPTYIYISLSSIHVVSLYLYNKEKQHELLKKCSELSIMPLIL